VSKRLAKITAVKAGYTASTIKYSIVIIDENGAFRKRLI
jgi:hypothetical protein